MAGHPANEEKATAQQQAARAARKEAQAALRARTSAEAGRTKKALIPLRNRVQDLIRGYEDCASFEHARRMDKLLHGLVRAVEMGCQEAGKDLARISEGGTPCQPSVLRQRLDDLLWDSQ